jgi:Rrf2 family iron-sulfur cluster assembly transcriptional regulator
MLSATRTKIKNCYSGFLDFRSGWRSATITRRIRGMYGKQTEAAIAVMSRLAEVYDDGRTRLPANDIADARGLQRPRVAKVLSVLSLAGLVTGSRGPGGGFTLARRPDAITIHDVFVLFDRRDDTKNCPFGGGICGAGRACPLHEEYSAVNAATERFLKHTTFEKFRTAYQDDGWRPARSSGWKTPKPN